MDTQMDKIMTIPEVATYLKLSKSKVQTDSGSLTFSRQCIAYKFPVRAASAWLTHLAVSADMET